MNKDDAELFSGPNESCVFISKQSVSELKNKASEELSLLRSLLSGMGLSRPISWSMYDISDTTNYILYGSSKTKYKDLSHPKIVEYLITKLRKYQKVGRIASKTFYYGLTPENSKWIFHFRGLPWRLACAGHKEYIKFMFSSSMLSTEINKDYTSKQFQYFNSGTFDRTNLK